MDTDRVHPEAVAAGSRAGLDLSRAAPRVFRLAGPADLVVTVCDQAHEELDPEPTWWHWSLPDPVEDGRAAAFDAVITELDDRICAVTVGSPQR